jgi:hypothetical protein
MLEAAADLAPPAEPVFVARFRFDAALLGADFVRTAVAFAFRFILPPLSSPKIAIFSQLPMPIPCLRPVGFFS